MADGGAKPARGDTSSDRTLSVMDLFTPERPEWTVEQACAVMGQSESTVYRYFRSLSAAGLIFSIRPGRYLLGPGIVHYERQLRTSDPLIRAVSPHMLRLAAEFEGPGVVFISRVHRDSVMSMHEHPLGTEPFPEGTYARGRLAPLFGGAPAYAILSFLEVRAARALFQRAGGGDGEEWLEVKRRMRAVRSAGYAVGLDDPDPGVLHVSVPLRHPDFGTAGSLSLALASTGDDAQVVQRAIDLLLVTADETSREALTSAPG
ncbi:IclR family transcriptional regulator [Kineococcus rhizosphaerae]|nr:helix-turn-helix domain-containing protein [Kineococcus rhizosphaerae]